VTRDLPPHVRENRRYWDSMAHDWVAMGERAWAREEPAWGEWGVPESELEMLPDDMSGMRAIELGCGTAYVSAWMTRRGARVVAIDNSAAQLATARRLGQGAGEMAVVDVEKGTRNHGEAGQGVVGEPEAEGGGLEGRRGRR